MAYISDSRKVEVGIPLAFVTNALKPMDDFKSTPVGQRFHLLLKCAADDIAPNDGTKGAGTLLRRIWRATDAIIMQVKLPDDTKEANYARLFHISLGFLLDISKLPCMSVTRQLPAYKAFLEFCDNLINAPAHERSTIGDAYAADAQKVLAGRQLALEVAQSHGLYT